MDSYGTTGQGLVQVVESVLEFGMCCLFGVEHQNHLSFVIALSVSGRFPGEGAL